MHFWLAKNDLTDERLISRFGSLWDGLQPHSRSLRIQEWFLTRRVIIAATALYALGHLWFAIVVLFIVSLFTLALIAKNPFMTVNALRTEAFNEVCLLIIQYHMLSFTDLVGSVQMKIFMGISCAAVSLLNIAINLLVVLKVLLKALGLLAKRIYNRCCMRKKRKKPKVLGIEKDRP